MSAISVTAILAHPKTPRQTLPMIAREAAPAYAGPWAGAASPFHTPASGVRSVAPLAASAFGPGTFDPFASGPATFDPFASEPGFGPGTYDPSASESFETPWPDPSFGFLPADEEPVREPLTARSVVNGAGRDLANAARALTLTGLPDRGTTAILRFWFVTAAALAGFLGASAITTLLH